MVKTNKSNLKIIYIKNCYTIRHATFTNSLFQMIKNKVIVFGSNGLVGNSMCSILSSSDKVSNLIPSTRKDTDLENKKEIKDLLLENNPDYVINCAAKVGGIHANNTYRADFLIKNLKINLNILDVLIEFPNIKLINLGSSCIYPLNAPNPLRMNLIRKLEPTTLMQLLKLLQLNLEKKLVTNTAQILI